MTVLARPDDGSGGLRMTVLELLGDVPNHGSGRAGMLNFDPSGHVSG
jgi:hypothetical protein